MIHALLLAAVGPVATPPQPADPLTVKIEAADADRFAALYAPAADRPTAEQLQREYLDRGSYGVHVLMDGRIENAPHLAAAVAAKPAFYARAVRTYLSVMKAMSGELRATYLALHGLLPERTLPHVYLVVGADNPGGTADQGAQVLGLETPCGISDTPEALRERVRAFFAHADLATTGGREGRGGQARHAGERRAPPLGRQLRRRAGGLAERGRLSGRAAHLERWYARQPDKRAAIRRLLTLDRLDEVLAQGALPAAQQLR